MAELIIFDDGRGQMGPLDDLRPVFALRTGGILTYERIERALGQFVSGWWVQARHEDVWSDSSSRPVNSLPSGSEFLCINGRWSGCGILPLPTKGQAVVSGGGEVLAACLAADDAKAFLEHGSLPESIDTQEVDGLPVYAHAWDLLNWLSEALADDLEAEPFSPTAAERAECAGEHPVSIDDSSVVFPGVVFDTHAGPIFVGPDVTIRPNAVLVGPCWIGRSTVVSEGAVIRGNTVIGPHCRVGGEVGATIFQGFSNKVHDGYMGDSYVGQWVNIGADTVTSNLLNTYGEISVRLEPDGSRSKTGRMFLGSLIADHVKTAICTRLMTGTVLGTGAMVATTAAPPTSVDRFAWLTDSGARTYQLDKFLDMTRTVMARRQEELSAVDEARLCSLHADVMKRQG
ncbi:MAG: hypothetical protein MK089_02220 [Phycisphaerales bacterium]|nr:hypothetical protein [Phycisphaerales bacterium]